MSGRCIFEWTVLCETDVSLASLYMAVCCISLCEFCGVSHNCRAEVWRMIVSSCRTSLCGFMLMLRMRQRKSLPGNGCESSPLLVGEHLICLLGWYHWLFHCEVSWHSTSVKVAQCQGTRCTDYPKFSL